MARIRTIKPEFWRDEVLASISAEAALLAIGLLNHCDDEGYFNANPKLVESDVFPLRTLAKSTTELLRELSCIGYIEVFSGSDGKTYGKVANFEKHQVINKKTLSKIKGLCELRQDYQTTTVVLPTGKEGKGMEVEKERKAPKVAATVVACPPDVQEQVWKDWQTLRKMKKAPVTETVVDSAKKEAAKANMSFNDFLVVWCRRGSQGLEADWLKPHERQSFAQQAADVARTTVPARNTGPDPVLLQIAEDRKKASPPPANLRDLVASMKGALK
jgi:hypothetical protein